MFVEADIQKPTQAPAGRHVLFSWAGGFAANHAAPTGLGVFLVGDAINMSLLRSWGGERLIGQCEL
jgi:hypothetical protein